MIAMEEQEERAVDLLRHGVVNDAQLPDDFRYKTNFLGSFFFGVMVIGWLVVFGAGVFSVPLAIIGVWCCVYGCLGIFSDPVNVLRSAGKRLVITEGCLQEIDEKANVRWVVMPNEIKEVVKRNKGQVPLWPLQKDIAVEVWELVLVDGKRITIPVWLLPEEGRGFKLRFQAFRGSCRKSSKTGGQLTGG